MKKLIRLLLLSSLSFSTASYSMDFRDYQENEDAYGVSAEEGILNGFMALSKETPILLGSLYGRSQLGNVLSGVISKEVSDLMNERSRIRAIIREHRATLNSYDKEIAKYDSRLKQKGLSGTEIREATNSRRMTKDFIADTKILLQEAQDDLKVAINNAKEAKQKILKGESENISKKTARKVKIIQKARAFATLGIVFTAVDIVGHTATMIIKPEEADPNITDGIFEIVEFGIQGTLTAQNSEMFENLETAISDTEETLDERQKKQVAYQMLIEQRIYRGDFNCSVRDCNGPDLKEWVISEIERDIANGSLIYIDGEYKAL